MIEPEPFGYETDDNLDDHLKKLNVSMNKKK